MTSDQKDVAALRKELNALLDKCRDADGKIPKRGERSNYLKTPDGKHILQLAVELFGELGGWDEITKLLNRERKTIESWLSKHQISIPRKEHFTWTKEAIAEEERFFKDSHTLRDKKELAHLWQEMKQAISKTLGKKVTDNGIWFIARQNSSWGHWGMSKENRERQSREICEQILNNDSLSPHEKKNALIKAMPWIKTWAGLRDRIIALGYEPPDLSSQKRADSKTAQAALQREIRERLTAHIAVGALVNPEIGPNKLFALIHDEFALRLKEAKLTFKKADFPALLDEVYWTKDRLNLLDEVLQSSLLDPIAEFCKHSRTCTRKMAEKKAREKKGVTTRDTDPAHFIPGLGRLDLEEIDPEEVVRFRLPKASAGEPYEVDITQKAFTINVVNGPNIGLAYDIDIERNVPRRALAESRVRGAKAVVMSGLFDLDLKKAAGPLKVHRALVSGLKVKPETLEVSYQKEARRVLEERKDISKKDTELLYLTVAERLELVLDAWHKITHRPKNRKHPKAGNIPEFNRPVYLIFGYKEEELITSAAYWEARWLTIKKQEDVRVHISLKKHEIQEARDAFEPEEVIQKLEGEKTALERQLARTIITNVSEEDLTRQFRRILPLVVKKFESTIPNSKVIGMGTSYIKFGNKVIDFSVPDHTRPLPTLLANYTKKYAPKVLRGHMADSVVILHPHALQHRSIDRSRDAKGKRNSVLVHVAPVAVDAAFLRRRLRHLVRKVHPISKMVFAEEFEPGILVLDFHNNLIDGYQIDTPALAMHEELEKNKDGTWKHVHIPLREDPVLKWINLITTTDLHYGSRNREQVYAPDLGQYVGCDEMMFLLMERAGLPYTSDFPFHMYAMNDDGVQANHLLMWQQQPNPQELPLEVIEKKNQELEERGKKARTLNELRAIIAEGQRFNLRQFTLRPPDWLQNQLRLLCHKHVDEHVDIYGSILTKALNANLTFKGVSDYEGTLGDARDLACINSGSGNHATKGTKGEMTEGWIISDRIWLRLLGDLKRDTWRTLGEEKLRRLVRAPLYSNIFVAQGTVQAPGGYEWAFDLRSSPPKMKGWNDTLAGWVFVDPSRGNYARFYEKPESSVEESRVVVKTCGDKHFHASARTSYALYVMCAPSTHTDQFAEMAGGLPPNSTGITSICLPKDGPGSGPILVRFFPFEWLKFYIEHPEEQIDWQAMFPNPL